MGGSVSPAQRGWSQGGLPPIKIDFHHASAANGKRIGPGFVVCWKTMVDYSRFEKSLRHLEAQLQNCRASAERPELGDIDREAIAESVIRRFEICYDCLWKILKRHLRENLGIPDSPNSPKPLFRLAFENRLFPSIEQWLSYADARIDTSHDYSQTKAQATVESAFAFAADAAKLYEKMTGKPWTCRHDLETLLSLLERHLPGTMVWAFGSRVQGNAVPWSDLDLVVFSATEQKPQVSALKEAIEESSLPFRVDLLEWNSLPDGIKANIEASPRVVLVGTETGGESVQGEQG